MYKIVCKDKFSPTLDIPEFAVRFANFVNSEKKNVIYLKDVFDNSTFRYRTYNVIGAMEGSNKYLVSCFLTDEISRLVKHVSKIDLVILQRCKWSFELESFINYVKSKEIKVIYDMDDLIYSPKYVPYYLNNIGYYDEKNIDVHFAMAIRYYKMTEMSDGYLVTTEALKENMMRDFGKKCFVYYNFLNREQEEIADKILEEKAKLKDSSKFVIGYFSGSNSHARDLKMAEEAIIELMEKYEDIYLLVVGYMNFSDKLNSFRENGRIMVHPFVTYQELEYLIASVDVNIVPLQDNEFNICKSELKYFEASIVDTVTVASDNIVYASIIEDGVNGFLASERNWLEKLEYIYLNSDKMNDIIDKARVFCKNRYGFANQCTKLEKLYDDIIDM